MQSTMRVPASWISSCSFENSRNIVSMRMSALLIASTAGRLPASGVAPTVQEPTSPLSVGDSVGRRTWNAVAPSWVAAARNASQ